MDYLIGGLHCFSTKMPSAELLLRLKPQWLVIVCGTEHADAISKGRNTVIQTRDLLPGTAIGVRWWDDNKIALRYIREEGSVDAAVQRYVNTFFPLAVANTWLMVGNEEDASVSDPGIFAQVCAFHAGVLAHGNAGRIPLGYCCTAMGEPDYPQYDLLEPVFREAQQGIARGVYHIWRPNAYFPNSRLSPAEQVSNKYHLTQRHQREGARVCAENGLYPPLIGIGEYNTVVSLQNNLEGPNAIPGYTDDDWISDLLYGEVVDPYAVYCWEGGLYNEMWASFDMKRMNGAIDQMLARLPRSPYTMVDAYRRRIQVTNPSQPYPTPNPEDYGPLAPGWVESMPQLSANIRQHPDTSAPILGSVVVGDALQVRPRLFPEEGTNDGFKWQAIQFEQAPGIPRNGWLFNGVKIRPGTLEQWLLELPAPFVSQTDGNADLDVNDCLIAACLTMAFLHHVQAFNGRIPQNPTVDELVPLTRLAGPTTTPLNFNDGAAIAVRLGFVLTYLRPLRKDSIVAQLRRGRAVGCLVDRSILVPGTPAIPHFVVVTGYSETRFQYHDPLGGPTRSAHYATLEAAMAQVPQNSQAYQGFVLDF